MAITLNADLLAIKAELSADPAHLGLTTLAADDAANATKLNAVAALIVKKRSLATAAIFNAVDPIEYQGLTDQQAKWFGAMLSLSQIDPFVNTGIVAGLDGMFASESASRPAYTALLTQPGSRMNQMFQAGLLTALYTITPSDVANARAAS